MYTHYKNYFSWRKTFSHAADARVTSKDFVYSLLYYFFVYFRFALTMFYLINLSSSFMV